MHVRQLPVPGAMDGQERSKTSRRLVWPMRRHRQTPPIRPGKAYYRLYTVTCPTCNYAEDFVDLWYVKTAVEKHFNKPCKVSWGTRIMP